MRILNRTVGIAAFAAFLCSGSFVHAQTTVDSESPALVKSGVMPEALRSIMPLKSRDLLARQVLAPVLYNGKPVSNEFLLGDFYGRTGFFDVNPSDFDVFSGDSIAEVMNRSGLEPPIHFETIKKLESSGPVHHVILKTLAMPSENSELSPYYWFALDADSGKIVAGLEWELESFNEQVLEPHHFQFKSSKAEIEKFLSSGKKVFEAKPGTSVKEEVSAIGHYFNAPYTTRQNILPTPYVWGRFVFDVEEKAVGYAKYPKSLPEIDLENHSAKVFKSFGDLVEFNQNYVPLRPIQASMIASHPEHYFMMLSEIAPTKLVYAHSIWVFDRNTHAPFMTILFNNPGERSERF